MAITLIEPGRDIRPTRHGLVVAMAVSACVVAALLALLGSIVGLVLDIPGPKQSYRERLTVVVRAGEAEPKSELAEDAKAVPPLATREMPAPDLAASQIRPESRDSPELSVDHEPWKDWHAMAEDAVRASVADYFNERESLDAMWRQSHSIMFSPASDFEFEEEEPFIPDFRFKPRIQVVGLGFTIGSCFIGIPLAGVPVEQRSAAMTFFVCAEDS